MGRGREATKKIIIMIITTVVFSARKLKAQSDPREALLDSRSARLESLVLIRNERHQLIFLPWGGGGGGGGHVHVYTVGQYTTK